MPAEGRVAGVVADEARVLDAELSLRTAVAVDAVLDDHVGVAVRAVL